MTIKVNKPKRCIDCGKGLRDWNESEYCTYCRNRKIVKWKRWFASLKTRLENPERSKRHLILWQEIQESKQKS